MLRRPGAPWDTADVSAVLDVSRPTPLRLLGFVCTALGGVLIAWGAISDWATVVFLGAGFRDSATPGADVAEGRVALALGVVMLISIVALRVVTSTVARRSIALGVCVAAAVALGIGIVDLVRAEERFGDYAVEEIASDVSRQQGIPIAEARLAVQAVVDDDGSIEVGLGLWSVLAGGAVGLVGGLLDLAWVGQQRLREAEGLEPSNG